MLYLMANSSCPMQFLSAGKLISADGFLHPKRKLDNFVLICVLEGTLHITQDNTAYSVQPGEFILLLADALHFGTTPSAGALSYYWAHFHVSDESYSIYSQSSLLRSYDLFNPDANYTSSIPFENYLLPVWGHIGSERRSHLLFSQLLDISRRENYNATWRCHYAISLLLLELTNEAFRFEHFKHTESSGMPVRIAPVIEWIRTHYQEHITVDSLARRFHYHPVYLTRLFKEYTGYPLLAYISRTRLEIAKNLLSSTTTPIYTIAETCGFTDCKHFLKLFKKIEGVTPSQYRKAFYQKKINTQ